MNSINYTVIDSPIGQLLLAGTGERLENIRFLDAPDADGPEPGWHLAPDAFQEAGRQLHAYFAGSLRSFQLTLAPAGTLFQRSVWDALLAIPYGSTTSYGEIARRIGRPKSVRAVGAANGANPLPIVIPCHRVVGSTGKLTGYGGGLAIKEALLRLERRDLLP